MIKAGIFDVGGVLHTNEMQNVFEDIKKTLQIDDQQLTSALDLFAQQYESGKVDEPEYWRMVLQFTESKANLPEESLYLREFSKRFTKQEEVLNMVRQLKSIGIKLAVLSNTIPVHADYLTKQGLYDSFDVKVFSYEVKLRKPNPEIFHLTLRKLHVRPEEAFFVDDLEENVVVANKLGIHGIVFRSAQQFQEDLRKLGFNMNL